MVAHIQETVVNEDGTVRVRDVPFRPGDRVEVIIVPRVRDSAEVSTQSLRDTVLKDDAPFGPAISKGDWETL